ncbi:MAG: NAD(P)H-dependent oxidoreductase subunit E [Phycisphaerae bacterium]
MGSSTEQRSEAQSRGTGQGAVAEPSETEIESVLDSLDVSPASNLIGVLQDIQDRFGYLPPAALGDLSRRMRLPLSRIYGVVSFYAQFYTEPRGRHTIRCCRGTACHVKGAGRVLDAVQRELGIEEGEMTPDMMFQLETVACLGTCFLAPAMMIDHQYFGNLNPQRAQRILQDYRTRNA